MADIYLVAGATGRLGQPIVSRLLRRNRHVRALVRDLQKGRALLGENLELVQGDTRQIDTLHDAVNGVHTVLCATGSRTPEGVNSPEQVDYVGVRNLVMVAKQANVQRFLLVTSIAVTRPEYSLNQSGHVLEWKHKGEDVLRESGLDYTIVRPGGLTDEPGGEKALRVEQGDQLSGSISRDDLAEVCLRALDHSAAHHATFEVVEADGAPPSDWAALFEGLRPDAAAHA